jgi:hypothetical protein
LRERARDFVLHRRADYPNQYLDQADVEEHVSLMNPGGDIIVGPKHLAIIQQLRDEAFNNYPYAGVRIMTDLFVWGRGEPSIRALTKIGGLPYWPVDKPWPRGSDGKQCRFIAQICFADSTDLAGSLPGQVLLIFGDDDALLCELERLVFEWLPLGLHDVVTKQVEIDPEELLSPYYGVLHRIADWPEAAPVLAEEYRYPGQIAVIEGTKIGGVPSWIQYEEDMPGRFLCSLGSVSVPPDQEWPFVNLRDPLGFDHGDHHLMIGDMGSLYLFVDSHGTVRATSQCY